VQLHDHGHSSHHDVRDGRVEGMEKNRPDLPRASHTVLGVMKCLFTSRILDDFEGCEVLERKDVYDRIEKLGKSYGYGQFVDSDGKTR
jgi:hypothetical protein